MRRILGLAMIITHVCDGISLVPRSIVDSFIQTRSKISVGWVKFESGSINRVVLIIVAATLTSIVSCQTTYPLIFAVHVVTRDEVNLCEKAGIQNGTNPVSLVPFDRSRSGGRKKWRYGIDKALLQPCFSRVHCGKCLPRPGGYKWMQFLLVLCECW